jgi:hypothetical protein
MTTEHRWTQKNHKCTMRDEKQNLFIYLYYYAKTHEQKKSQVYERKKPFVPFF